LVIHLNDRFSYTLLLQNPMLNAGLVYA
jgi:hypothetical protein